MCNTTMTVNIVFFGYRYDDYLHYPPILTSRDDCWWSLNVVVYIKISNPIRIMEISVRKPVRYTTLYPCKNNIGISTISTPKIPEWTVCIITIDQIMRSRRFLGVENWTTRNFMKTMSLLDILLHSGVFVVRPG